ncbi:DUF3237 family protein [Leucobacter chromiireducens]|uniref:DUF3237 domain-containing protein n=1 Tax=Leucobacter chromiireducens subsp. chromiireducens TaxID=660067 RepID=A0ABS1SPG0_9MICO|nr:DUF3237 domain-containing protein [Leucobacter chromiireducens subsp. chromiireducens]
MITASHAGSPLSLKPACQIAVTLGAPLTFGVTRDGERRVTPILGGTLLGIGESFAGLRAAVLPGGSDRQLVRADGTVEIDARYEARTDAGELIGIHASGIRRATPDGVYFRAVLRFEAASATWAALQDAVFLADGAREANAVRHTVFRVG